MNLNLNMYMCVWPLHVSLNKHRSLADWLGGSKLGPVRRGAFFYDTPRSSLAMWRPAATKPFGPCPSRLPGSLVSTRLWRSRTPRASAVLAEASQLWRWRIKGLGPRAGDQDMPCPPARPICTAGTRTRCASARVTRPRPRPMCCSP